jgi:hypothetical protein
VFELTSYAGLFLAAFGAATLLPMQSKAVLVGMLLCDQMSMEQALMKLSALLIAALLSISSAAAFAHSDGTDSKGCHRNHKTNDYHCH